MQVSIRKMGNSQGILIPKPILKQLGLVDVADLQVNGNVIGIRPLKPKARAGQAAAGEASRHRAPRAPLSIRTQ